MTTSAKTPSLENMVAVVTAASRGADRGIAAVLGENGATVYVTGHSVRGRPSAPSRSGSIEETAEEVIRRGGTAVAVRCDHAIDAEIAELFGRVRREHGRLDLLVNNAWGGYEQRGDSASSFLAPRSGSSRPGAGRRCSASASGLRSSPAARPRRCCWPAAAGGPG